MNKINVVKPSFELAERLDMIDMCKRIEKIGRLCYKSENKITDSSCVPFVEMLLARGHEAMIEHVSISVKLTIDRGVSHEIVRHRLGSYSQESTRFCNYTNSKFDGAITVIDIEGCIENDLTMKDLPIEVKKQIVDVRYQAMLDSAKHYNDLISLGATPQMARSVLTNSTKTEIWITFNLREWRSFFKLRSAKPAHPQMREVVVELLNISNKRFQYF